MAARLELQIVKGQNAGKRYKVGPKGIRLGRSRSNDIQESDDELSRTHCLFEPYGETGIRVTDLASANGTFLNGQPLVGEPMEVQVGDVIEAGRFVICVVEHGRSARARSAFAIKPERVSQDPPSDASSKRLLPIAFALVLAVVGAIAYRQLSAPAARRSDAVEMAEPVVREVAYERVEANVGRIYRRFLTLNADGMLSIVIDDVPEKNRHVSRNVVLGSESFQALRRILSWDVVGKLPEAEEKTAVQTGQLLDSRMLKVVYDRCVRTFSLSGADVPEDFLRVENELNAFAKKEFDMQKGGE